MDNEDQNTPGERPTKPFDEPHGSANLGVPWMSPAQIRLHELAREYIDRTEAYDRTVCTGPILRGGIIPVTMEERRLCTRNAISLRDRLFSHAQELGFGWGDWIRAIQRMDRESPNDKLIERPETEGGAK